MIPAKQDDFLGKLADLRELSPDVRFGQLLANLGFLVEDRADRSLWDVEDADLLAVMEEHRQDLLRRHPADARSSAG